MPPKRAAASSIVGEYDVEQMTEKELRLYIEALTQEHKRMRKLRNLYHKDYNELLGVFKTVQENVHDKKGVDLQNNWEIQQMVLQLELLSSKHEDAVNKIEKIETDRYNETNNLNAFINFKMTEIRNREDEDALLKTIRDRDREIQHMEYLHDLITNQLKENDFIKRQGLSKNCDNTFQNFVKECNENFLERLRQFSSTKVEELLAVWGDIPQTENNSLADTLSKMNDYFKDIYWKNLKTIEELHSTLINLQKELNTLKLNLRYVAKENEERKTLNRRSSPPPPSIAYSNLESLSFNSDKETAFKELLYENHLLSIKLEMLNNEFNDLKSQFTSAVRRLYQKADFKSFLSEKKILSAENINRIG